MKIAGATMALVLVFGVGVCWTWVEENRPPFRDENGFNPFLIIPSPIPAIMEPEVATAEVADLTLESDELVLGVEINGEARAYPINMLKGPWREVVNDRLGGVPIAATWSFQGHNGVVYSRNINDRQLTFTVSGLLWKRGLVMRDLETGSLWSQPMGRCMRGDMLDDRLPVVPAILTDWLTWKKAFPHTTAMQLTPVTQEFHLGYYYDREYFVVGMLHDQGNRAKAWKFADLDEHPLIHEEIDQQPVVLFFDSAVSTPFAFDRRIDGQTLNFVDRGGTIVDDQTQSTWDLRTGTATSGQLQGKRLNPHSTFVSFTSAWSAFYPHSEYYSEPAN